MANDSMITKKLELKNLNDAPLLMGPQNRFFSLLEDGMKISIDLFNNSIKISSKDEQNVNKALDIIKNMLKLIHQGINLNDDDFVSAMKMANNNTLDYFTSLYNKTLIKNSKGQAIRVKNFGQREYVQSVSKNDVTFGIGPAGTGKTYLAVVMAVASLRRGDVEKIILTRPAVEAGESLGYLPGDLKDKIDPYLRPIYDALFDIIGTKHARTLIERGIIEIAPLAYMRGRTLDEAFVILDEAQNTTNPQMKMFLTRLGFGSKMIVNGDISQIDLPRHSNSGLVIAQTILHHVKGIKFVKFNAEDVVRHPVVSRIINAYENKDN